MNSRSLEQLRQHAEPEQAAHNEYDIWARSHSAIAAVKSYFNNDQDFDTTGGDGLLYRHEELASYTIGAGATTNAKSSLISQVLTGHIDDYAKRDAMLQVALPSLQNLIEQCKDTAVEQLVPYQPSEQELLIASLGRLRLMSGANDNPDIDTILGGIFAYDIHQLLVQEREAILKINRERINTNQPSIFTFTEINDDSTQAMRRYQERVFEQSIAQIENAAIALESVRIQLGIDQDVNLRNIPFNEMRAWFMMQAKILGNTTQEISKITWQYDQFNAGLRIGDRKLVFDTNPELRIHVDDAKDRIGAEIKDTIISSNIHRVASTLRSHGWFYHVAGQQPPSGNDQQYHEPEQQKQASINQDVENEIQTLRNDGVSDRKIKALFNQRHQNCEDPAEQSILYEKMQYANSYMSRGQEYR